MASIKPLASAITVILLAFTIQTASAQDDGEDATSPAKGTWRDSVIARCIEQYGAEPCQDNEFLEKNFHLNSLETAHRAANRRNRQADDALRELTLQRVCNVPVRESCARDAQAAQCAAQLAQACAQLKAEAANCSKNAQLTCINTADAKHCYAARSALCPSPKKQPIERLLTKYPDLSASQKARLRHVAAELDAKTSGWWSNLLGWLGTPFH